MYSKMQRVLDFMKAVYNLAGVRNGPILHSYIAVINLTNIIFFDKRLSTIHIIPLTAYSFAKSLAKCPVTVSPVQTIQCR